MSNDLKTVLNNTMADLEQRLLDSKATRTGKRETLDELIAWANQVEAGPLIDITDMPEDEFIAMVMEPSPQPSLADLEREFDAARSDFAYHNSNILIEKYNDRRNSVAKMKPEVAAQWVFKEKDDIAEKVILAARRFIIARDFHEFEDGKWQMLWHLKYGGSI